MGVCGGAESGLGAAVGGASGVSEEGRGSGRDGKIRFIFFIGWRGRWGCSVMAPHCILYICRWKKMKMFSE